MKITTLVENNAPAPLMAVHGLALYIETNRHKLLFDVGTGGALFQNAKLLGVDLTAVDTVIISHGHYDHGNDLSAFLALNTRAKVYLQRTAFDDYYVRLSQSYDRKYIGLDVAMKDHPQVVLVDGDCEIDEELNLFCADTTARFHSTANDCLYEANGLDRFKHEQNLVIREGERTALIMGCGHSGVVNILDKATQWKPQLCVGGYHLYNPVEEKTVSDALLDDIAKELSKYSIHFYTCHCTGEYAFQYLQQRIPQMDYLSCGTNITL